MKLKIYCQKITYSPAPLEAQACVRSGNFIWCRDWEIIEILKCLFLGKTAYFGDTPPRRLQNNPLWKKEDIAFKAEVLLHMCKDAEEIIGILKTRRGENAAS